MNVSHPDYKNYGGRGITICIEWVESYETFLSNMGRCQSGCSLERIDNNKGYSPENCKWGTLEEQNNNRRSNVFITHNGITMTISQWARRVGIKKITLWQRIKDSGWSIEKALTTPVYANGKEPKR